MITPGPATPVLQPAVATGRCKWAAADTSWSSLSPAGTPSSLPSEAPSGTRTQR